MHKEIEVYVVDMIAKSDREESHVENLRKLFERLRKYTLRLNPAKCTFRVKVGEAIGFRNCVLGQRDGSNKNEHATYYLSKKFTEYEVRYSNLEKMCCTLAWTARRLRIARWQVVFAKYDIVYVSPKAIKRSIVEKFLAGHAKEEYEPMSFDFPNEEIMLISKCEEEIWRVYFNRASKMMELGIRAVLISPNGQYFPATDKLMLTCMNNIVEYEACILALQIAIEKKIRVLKVFGDSALVVYQTYVHGLIKEFDDAQFCHLTREENQLADALATLAAMFEVGSKIEVQPIQLRVKDSPAHYAKVELGTDGKPWYVDIKRYLQYEQYLDCASKNDKRIIRRLAMGFFLESEVLYERGREKTY
ncbi:uncharacterized protein LOC105781529 [Gossypium raimondii]|uniref:uncharacterized protein LOC105781529 n=1 Tax=Gossypium raimondii TaxID=29730 RepID=UPI00063AB07B|nr:uncharacterized protein LOC105781529 [Gossypium raimondii]